MGKIKYLHGDLIHLAKEKKFDAITHGCNCFNTMGGGIAVPFRHEFQANKLIMEQGLYKGLYSKMGQIDVGFYDFNLKQITPFSLGIDKTFLHSEGLFIINSYTQYHYNPKVHVNPKSGVQLNYEAVAMCFDKINYYFKGMHLGVPQIGAGLAGGNWDRIGAIIEDVTPNIDITCVLYKK